MTLSVVINTKNAAETLERALRSVSFADQIVVVDMYSDDETCAIAKNYTKDVHLHADVGYVEPARNYAIQQASSEWILILDADEVISESLALTIQQIVRGLYPQEADCYYIARKNFIFGEHIKHSGWWPDYILRLFRKGAVSWSKAIHSVPITKGVVAELPTQIEQAIIHYHYTDVSQFVARLNRYTTVQARERLKDTTLETKDVLNFTKQFYQEFLSRFFAREGYKDKRHGLLLALLQGFSEVVVAAKVWEAQNFVKPRRTERAQMLQELATFQRELSYWVADANIQTATGLRKIYWQIRRRLRW